MATAHFTPKLFAFLRELEENNDRDWFKANQDDYERYVREPALDFVNDFADRLKKISPEFVADSRKVGGSLFRIHRDTRFSKDKTPYKTYTGIQFRHFATQSDVHAPGYYLHLEPRNCYIGMGLWHPATADAYRIRAAIAEAPAVWNRAAHGKRFRERFSLDGDSLTRPPKGYDADHPLIEDLKRKDFIAGTAVTQKVVTSAHFIDDFADLLRLGSPFMRFLCSAADVPF